MIEKMTGNFNVEKLRIVLLYEADFNANNKWIGQALMYKAKQAHLLAEEQFGSRKFNVLINSSFTISSTSGDNQWHFVPTMQKVVTIG